MQRVSTGHLVLSTLSVFLMISSVGCDDGSAERILMRRACLQFVYDGYAGFQATHDRGPAGIEEFADFAAKNTDADSTTIGGHDVANEALARLKEVEIVVIWGGKIPASAEERENCLLAFEARVPGSGGYIAPADGVIRHIVASDFSKFAELPIASSGSLAAESSGSLAAESSGSPTAKSSGDAVR